MSPPLNPDVADLAPSGHILGDYDEEHAVTYMRMLDADKEGADWREVSQIVLHIDPDHDADRARRAFDTHLAGEVDGAVRISATASPRVVEAVKKVAPTQGANMRRGLGWIGIHGPTRMQLDNCPREQDVPALDDGWPEKYFTVTPTFVVVARSSWHERQTNARATTRFV